MLRILLIILPALLSPAFAKVEDNSCRNQIRAQNQNIESKVELISNELRKGLFRNRAAFTYEDPSQDAAFIVWLAKKARPFIQEAVVESESSHAAASLAEEKFIASGILHPDEVARITDFKAPLVSRLARVMTPELRATSGNKFFVGYEAGALLEKVDEIISLPFLNLVLSGAYQPDRSDRTNSGKKFSFMDYALRKRVLDAIRRHNATTRGGRREHSWFDENLLGIPQARSIPELALLDDKREAVLRAIKRLPEKQRKIIELMFFHDMTLTQIAEELDTPLGTVKSAVSRAYDRLRSQLEEWDEQP